MTNTTQSLTPSSNESTNQIEVITSTRSIVTQETPIVVYVLNKGDRLTKGGAQLKSRNGKFTAQIREDGLFMVTYKDAFLWGNRDLIDRIEMRLDGKLAYYKGESLIKSSITSGRGEYAILDTDASLTVYDRQGNAIWFDGFLLSKKYFNFCIKRI